MTKQEFFDAIDELFRKRDEGLLGEEEWMYVQSITTCDTETCVNYEKYFPTQIPIPEDNIYRVVCGMCGQVITQIDPQFTDDPDYRLNVRKENGDLWI